MGKKLVVAVDVEVVVDLVIAVAAEKAESTNKTVAPMSLLHYSNGILA